MKSDVRRAAPSRRGGARVPAAKSLRRSARACPAGQRIAGNTPLGKAGLLHVGVQRYRQYSIATSRFPISRASRGSPRPSATTSGLRSMKHLLREPLRPLPAARRGLFGIDRCHAVSEHAAHRIVEGDPAVARRDLPAHAAVPVAMAPPADAAGTRAPGREQGPAGNPLPRGARDGPRQGRRDRQAAHGAEDAVPGRGRGRRARADDGRAQELVREEQRQVRAAAPAQLSASLLLARPARRPRARRRGSRRWRSSPASRSTRRSASSLADPFMFQEYYRDRAPEYLGKEFGPQFALAVGQASARLVAGAHRVRFRLAPACSSTP